MTMDLSRIYTPQPQQEELVKRAEAELFAKLAANQGIDLTKLDDNQISQLYEATFGKQAEFPPPAEDKKPEEKKDEDDKKDEAKKEEEKKEAAAREHATKIAAANDEANAYHLGQVMAQGYMDHLQKLGSALEAQTPAAAPAEGTKEAAMPANLAKALGKVKGVAGEAASKGVQAVKDHPRAAAGAAAAGAGAAGFAAGRMSGKKKESSALDELALEQAIKIAHDAGGLDLDEVADRLLAVRTLGLEESTKLASTVEQQVNIRALEFLEAAGYPVTWNPPAQ